MRYSTTLLALAIGVAGLGCERRELGRSGAGGMGVIGAQGAGGGVIGVPGGGGVAIGNPSGAAGAGGASVPPAPCTPADPRMVIASQRTPLLTSNQLINMIRALTDDVVADMVVRDQGFPVTSDFQRRFPPGKFELFKSIPDATTMAAFTSLARSVAMYLVQRFEALTMCAAPATDACATAYLAAFAEKAYRRPLADAERGDVDARYAGARTMVSVEEAVRQVVTAILVAPPFLYRSEMGDPARASPALAAVPLTPYELASALSFFLTDGPPDQPLLDAARAGTLTPETIAPHAERLLATPAARGWLTKVMETYFNLNTLPGVAVDTNKFPEATPQLFADMQTEAHLFLDFTLWNGTLTELLTSRATFVNTTLATTIYGITPPPEATATNFVRAALPVRERSGVLTNAGFLATRAHAVSVSLMARSMAVQGTMVGRDIPPAPEDAWPAESAAAMLLEGQTAQQQVASRASQPGCADCHVHFDPYGLAFDRYDLIGRPRLLDERGRLTDGHATLPPELGGVTVDGAVGLAQVLASSPAFVQRLAKAVLEYALLPDIPPERPSLPGEAPRAACAVNDVVTRFQSRPTRTFSGLLADVASSPAFAYRHQSPPPLP
jgi:uncharacterized protein DUF1592/uncharacterized protein DUF1588/uncharacterized protein DUF1595